MKAKRKTERGIFVFIQVGLREVEHVKVNTKKIG